MPDAIHAARSLGIELDALPARRFSGICFHDRDISAEAGFPAGHGLGIRRTVLHRYLADLAAGAGVHLAWGAAVSGISGHVVSAAGREIRARWIIGADGGRSRVRRWAALERYSHRRHRYGFRTHFRVPPWSQWMEVHWGDGCQLYLTPTGAHEVCVALLSDDPHLRLADALPRFPVVARRLAGCEVSHEGAEMGGVSGSCRLRSVTQGCVALVGEASGSVDAITGEGLCLLFQQAAVLGEALEAENLGLYQASHRRIARQPELMSRLLLLLARHSRLRQRVIRALAADPGLFPGLLAVHIGKVPPQRAISNGFALGWRLLSPFGRRI